MFVKTTITALLASVVSISAYASGGDYGGGGDSGSTGAYNTAPAKVVDYEYELGKSLVTGRHSAYKKTKYCFKGADNSAETLKSKTVKPYRNGAAADLLQDLYQCHDLSKSIANTLKPAEIQTVVYYLNKRYRLKLQ